MIPYFAALFDHEDLERTTGRLRQLTESNRAGKTCRAGPDEEDVDFESIALRHRGLVARNGGIAIAVSSAGAVSARRDERQYPQRYGSEEQRSGRGTAAETRRAGRRLANVCVTHRSHSAGAIVALHSLPFAKRHPGIDINPSVTGH